MYQRPVSLDFPQAQIITDVVRSIVEILIHIVAIVAIVAVRFRWGFAFHFCLWHKSENDDEERLVRGSILEHVPERM